MSDLLFQEALRLARAGKRREARDLLIEIVTVDEEHELTWLWLADLVDDPEDQLIALENALTLNPHNEQAWQRLQQRQAVQAEEVSEQSPPPTTNASGQDLDAALTEPGRNLAAT